MRQQEALCHNVRGQQRGKLGRDSAQNKQGLNSPQWEYTKISLKNVCSLWNLSWTVQHLQNSLLFSLQMTEHLDLAN